MRDNPGAVLGDRMTAISDFDGYVVAWSIGDGLEVLHDADAEFEVEIPDQSRKIPALIGLLSSSAERVGGKQCLLHPILTCLAQEGEVFDPPLRLRFFVGDVDAIESGSDEGTPEDAEAAYRAHLESTYSAWKREDAHSKWCPIDGAIEPERGGIFVLEVAVSYFCDFALKQDTDVESGAVEFVELPRLKRKGRRSYYHFVNLGKENIVVYCWGAARKRGLLDSFRLKLGLGLASWSAEVRGIRKLVDLPDKGVYKVDVPGNALGERRKDACLVADGPESLTVAHMTQETVGPFLGGTHELAQVWGRRSMQHKHAMVFGDLTDSSRMVPNLRVEDGVNVGELVKSIVG
ncbi:unnamed protein product [Scytosiphon promiscuus]